MEPAVTAVRHFARLVWLLLHDAANVDEQKAALRALVLSTKDAPLPLVTHDDQLVVNGTVVAPAFAGVTDMAARMAAHGLCGIDFVAGNGVARHVRYRACRRAVAPPRRQRRCRPTPRRRATPDAVQRLLAASEPERRYFRGRRTALRSAAVQGLAEARTPAALDRFWGLRGDREHDVRDVATSALARIARTSDVTTA